MLSSAYFTSATHKIFSYQIGFSKEIDTVSLPPEISFGRTVHSQTTYVYLVDVV